MLKKVWNYILVGVKATGKFLKYIYAPYMVLAVLSGLFGIFVSWLVGVIFLVIDVLLLNNEIKLTKERELELLNKTKTV